LPSADKVFTSLMISVKVLSVSGAARPESQPAMDKNVIRRIVFMINWA